MKKIKSVLCWFLIAISLLGCAAGNTAETTDPATDIPTDAPKTEKIPEITEIKQGSVQAGAYYTNNLVDNAADPFILAYKNCYYLYSTGGSKFSVRVSSNLKSWRNDNKVILKLSDLGWAKDSGWAPEMHEYNGKFYFIFSARNNDGIYAIDIAVGDTPDGKFEPLTKGTPFYQQEYSVIDGNLFFDDDGRIYMYYSKDLTTNRINGKKVSQVYGIEVKPDFSGTIGEPVLISQPEKEWELGSGTNIWNEAPAVFKKDGVYYLLYSAYYYKDPYYCVGYAVSDQPLRYFDKAENTRILRRNGETVTGPGHCNILYSPDGTEIYMVYHVHTVPPNSNGGRSLAIDRMIFKEDGTLAVDGPSTARRPLPSGISGFYHINSGFSYSTTGENTAAYPDTDSKFLFDWSAVATDSSITSFTNGGTVDISFEKEESIKTVTVYPANHADHTPRSVDVLVNGQYLIKDVKFKEELGSPACVTLTNLPDGVKVKELKITVYTAEGKENAALAEIIFIAKDE